MAIVAGYPLFTAVLGSIPYRRIYFGNPCKLLMERSYCLGCIFSSQPFVTTWKCNLWSRMLLLNCLWRCGSVRSVRRSVLQSKHSPHVWGKGFVSTRLPSSWSHAWIISPRWVSRQMHKQMFLQSWQCLYVNSSLAAGLFLPSLPSLWLKMLSEETKNADPLNTDNSC